METTNIVILVLSVSITAFMIGLALRLKRELTKAQAEVYEQQKIANDATEEALETNNYATDYATYNTELLTIFGKLFEESSELSKCNSIIADAGTLIEVDYFPGAEEAVLKALANPDVFREYVEYNDLGKAQLCLVPYSALQEWTGKLLELNKKHTDTFSNDLMKISKEFSNIISKK